MAQIDSARKRASQFSLALGRSTKHQMVLKLIFGVVGILFLLELVNLIKSVLAINWKATVGKIQNWDMHYSDNGDSTNLVVNNLEYSYSVSGIDYISKRIAFGFPMIMEALYVGKDMERILSDAPNLNVYYDAKKPKESSLMVGLKLFHLFKIFAFLLVLAFIGLAINEP